MFPPIPLRPLRLLLFDEPPPRYFFYLYRGEQLLVELKAASSSERGRWITEIKDVLRGLRNVAGVTHVGRGSAVSEVGLSEAAYKAERAERAERAELGETLEEVREAEQEGSG